MAKNQSFGVVRGKIIKGAGLGKKIGVPTLNFRYDGELRGVFVGRTFINRETYKVVLHIGPRPTVSDDEVICEVHLLDWDGELEEIEVELIKKIRDVQKFPSLDALKEQIAKDIEFAKMISC